MLLTGVLNQDNLGLFSV